MQQTEVIKRQIYNKDLGVWDKDDGHPGYSGLITAYATAVDETQVTLATITTGYKAYVKFMMITLDGFLDGFVMRENATTTKLVLPKGVDNPVILGNGTGIVMEIAEGVLDIATGTNATVADVLISYVEKDTTA